MNLRRIWAQESSRRHRRFLFFFEKVGFLYSF